MEEVKPNVVEASREKHTPYVTEEEGRVTVTVGTGENIHPMTAEHGIVWVCLVTTDGTQRKMLVPGAKPEVVFHTGKGERVIKAFAYCNLHGLWMWEAAD
jgi:superoxide reductase